MVSVTVAIPVMVAVVSPSAIEDAIGFAALADDEDAVAGVNGAEIAVHVVGRAIDEAGGARFPISGDPEIGAAAAVNPNAALAVAPRLAFDASGLAALANYAHAEAGIGRTPGSPHVIRGAVDHIRFAPAAEFIVATAEIAIPVIAAEISISAMVANNLAPSAIDTKKNKLLIVAAVRRKDLEMLSVAVGPVGQIQRLTSTRDNLHPALAEIFDSPQLGLGTSGSGEGYGHSLMNVGLRYVQIHSCLRGFDTDEARARFLYVPLLVWDTGSGGIPLAEGSAVAQVHVQDLATGRALDLVSARTGIAGWRLCLGQRNGERRDSNQGQRNLRSEGKSC